MNNEKIFKYLSYILLGIGVILGILFYANDPNTDAYNSENPPIYADLLFYYFYFLLFIAVAVSVLFPLFFIITQPKKAKNALIGIGSLLVVFFISYSLSGDEILPQYKNLITDPATSKLIGAGLIMVYILGGIAIFLSLFSGLTKYINK